VILAALLQACSSGPSRAPADGSAEVVASTADALSASSVASLNVTVSAPDIANPITKKFVRTMGVWQGIIGGIPVGTGRTFTANAYDATNSLIFSGTTNNVTIVAGPMTSVAMVLEQVNPPPPFSVQVPWIDSMVVSATALAPGATITLTAAAHDPDPTDPITYSWSAPAGTFGSPGSASTTWTAPATQGVQTITLQVTDSHNLTASMTVAVAVAANGASGSARVTTSFNLAPYVTAMNASPTRVDVGQSTTVTASATDPQNEPLAYAWTAACAGTFSNPTATSTVFTLAAPLPAGGSCTIAVAVNDGNGGRNSGAITIQTGPGATVDVDPQITSTYQSVPTTDGGDTVTFQASAFDPQSSPLTFAWTATAGTLGTATSTGGSSTVIWSAPSCIPTGTTPTITVTVTDALGLSATHAFLVTPTAAAACAVTVDASANALWKQSTTNNPISVLADGTVLNFTGGQSFDPATGAMTPVPFQANLPTTNYGYGPARLAYDYIVYLDPLGNERVFAGYLGAFVFTPAGGWVATVLNAYNCCDLNQIYAFNRLDGRIMMGSPGQTFGLSTTTYAWSDNILVPGWNGTTTPTPAYVNTGSYDAVSGHHVYWAGWSGTVARGTANTSAPNASTYDWSTAIDLAAPSPALRRGAVDVDDSFVVTSTTPDHGVLAKVDTSGAVVFNTDAGASSPPVIAADSTIYVGSSVGGSYAVRSYSPAGVLRWSTPVNGNPTELLLGDDGLVYAFLATTATGSQVVALSEATGTLKRDYTNLPTASSANMLLSNGRLFVSMSNSQLWALAAGATNYDPAAPWPTKRHDNYLTSGR
jgi:hypothetical protein